MVTAIKTERFGEGIGLSESGWRPVRVLDLMLSGQYPGHCDRCGRRDLRFLHIIESDNEGQLNVGCECAARLCCNYDGTGSESKLRNRYHRRGNWLKRFWGTSRNGNPILTFKHQGGEWITVTIFPGRFGGQCYCIAVLSDRWYSPRHYGTRDDAKLAAFDRLSELLDW